MKKGYTHISVVLDRSGSMSGIKNDAQGGLNQFIEDQQKLDGEATFSLVQFDHENQKIFDFVNVKDVEPYVLIPRGWTALLDAIGKEIVDLGNKLNSMDENDRPEKVIFVIVTDGAENSSKKYTKENIYEMIKHQEDTYKWEFVFMAANQDAIEAGRGIGVSFEKSMTFAANADGATNAFASLSTNTCAYRSGVDSTYNFKSSDRDKQTKAGA